jgi:hypothetical protein
LFASSGGLLAHPTKVIAARMPNQECAKLRAASIECSYSNRRQREHILGASDYHRIVGIRKRDADYPHLLIPHLMVCLLRPTQSLNGGRPGAKIETLQAEPAKLPRVHSRALNRL